MKGSQFSKWNCSDKRCVYTAHLQVQTLHSEQLGSAGILRWSLHRSIRGARATSPGRKGTAPGWRQLEMRRKRNQHSPRGLTEQKTNQGPHYRNYTNSSLIWPFWETIRKLTTSTSLGYCENSMKNSGWVYSFLYTVLGITNKTIQDDNRMTSQMQATLENCSGSWVFLNLYAQGAKSLVLTRETFSDCDLVSWGFWSPHMVQAWRQRKMRSATCKSMGREWGVINRKPLKMSHNL